MRIAIYTSLAINYLAKARVLVQTVKDLNPAIDVIAVVCDRFPSDIDPAAERFDQIWMVEDYPADNIKAWIFRHNIMELCTAVKGWALKRLLDEGYDYVMYLDPDCLVLEDPAKIIDLLPADCSVGVVPHTTREATSDEEIRIVETSSLRHGIYNLGFLLVRNDDSGRALANWWAARLDKYCVDDFQSGLFTDQRWFDLAVGYFDFIKVIRHHGIDVASWNVGQRTVTRNEDGYRIDGDELIFYHFSGVGPAGVHRWVREKFAPSDPLVAELEFRYERMLEEHGQEKLAKAVPAFDLYSDGTKVPAKHREFFRAAGAGAERYRDPYLVTEWPCLRSDAGGGSPSAANGAPTIAANGQGQSETLIRSIFDAAFFSKAWSLNPDDGLGLWNEYVAKGWWWGVHGNRFFDVPYYAQLVGDVDRAKFPTPFHHYMAEGRHAGLSPSWAYDETYYLSRYADIAEAVRNGQLHCGFQHFSLYGHREGRYGCAYFNELDYLNANPDVAAAVENGMIGSGAAHYVSSGAREQRRCS